MEIYDKELMTGLLPIYLCYKIVKVLRQITKGALPMEFRG